MRFIIFFLILGALLGCKKITSEGFLIYHIKTGSHSSHSVPRTLVGDVLEFECRFDESAIYTSSIPQNQYDINKLYGFSECNDRHHDNSARIGWRWLSGSLELHAYVYNDGVHSSKLIKAVELNKNIHCRIEIRSDLYFFYVDGTTVTMPRTNNCESGFYYVLFPYFGGDETAPHDIRILIRDLGGVR